MEKSNKEGGMASRIEAFIKLINILKQKCIKCVTCDATRLKSPHPQICIWNFREKEIHNCHVLLLVIKIQDAVAKGKESCMGNYKQNVFIEIYSFMLIRYLPSQNVLGSI